MRFSRLFAVVCSAGLAGACSSEGGNGGAGDNDPSLTISALALSTNEDTTISGTISAANAKGDLTVTVETPPAHGELNINATSLTYTPAANYAGADSAVLTVSDGTSSVTATVAVTIDAINDEPVLVVPEGQTVGLDETAMLSGITVSDVDATTVSVHVQADHGVFTLATVSGLTFEAGDGAGDNEVRFSGTPADVTSAFAVMLLKPALSYNGLVTLTIEADDEGQTGAGGAQKTTKSIVIGVGAVDLPPFNTLPLSATIPAGLGLPFINAIAVHDLDAEPTDLFDVTLAITYGTLTIANPAGITFIEATANGQATLHFTCAQADCNTALGRVGYVPGIAGTATLTLTTTSGGLTDSDTCAISVTDASSPVPPTSQAYLIKATRLDSTFSVRARGNNPAARVESLEVTACSGDAASTIVIEGSTIDCAHLPQTIAVANHTGETDNGNGYEHVFSGRWTIGSSNTSPARVITVRYSDSHEPALTSQTYDLTFGYRYVNQAPEVTSVGCPPGSGAIASYKITGQAGGGSLGWSISDDAASSALVHVDIKLTVDDITNNGQVSLTFLGGNQAYLGVQVPGQWYFIDGEISAINGILETANLTISQLSSVKGKVTLTVNDNGETGACTYDLATPCSRTASGGTRFGGSATSADGLTCTSFWNKRRPTQKRPGHV